MNTKLNERQREAASFEKSTVVVASAGTGKTTTLAATYIGLLERGLNPSEVLAITFTEKAAGEMRERIRRELLKKADRPDSDARWRKILNEISQAPISTIHSFCGQMIREHAVRLGIDPRFQILDETRSEDRLDRAVWSVLNERIRRDDQAVFSLVRLYDFEGAAKRGVVDLLKRLVKGLNDLGIFLSKPMCEGQGSWGGACRAAREREAAEIGGRFKEGVERLREAFDRIFRTERAAGKRGEDYLKLVHEKEEEIREALRNISTEASPEAARAFEFLSDFAKPGKLAERDENLPLIESLAQIKELLGKDSLLMSWFGLIKSLPASLMIEGLAREVQDRYQEEKEGENLDFTDLLFLARRLLRENVAARRNFQRRYKALLVDEFQDTDSVQAEIILLLGEADGAAERIDPGRSSWEVIRKVPLDPRKLFIVGDAKQSIYGFRGADIAVFRAVAQKITSLGHPPVALQENYRTVPELIDFTNRFFSSLLPSPGELSSEDDLRQYRTTFSDEDHLRPPKEGGAPPREPAQIILLTAESEEDSDTARWREAGAVAHLIRRWRSEGVLKNYKEAAILFRSRGEIGPYREALKRFGLPHYLVKAGRFFEQIEIVEMIGLLSFLRDPGDDLALARLMTSAMGGFSFGELAELTVRSAGPTLLGKIRKPPSFALPELAEKARRLAALIEELLSLRDRRHPHEILQAALDKTRYDAVLAALEDGELRVANIGKLIDLARSLSREGIAGLDDCIERICTMAQSVSQEPEASPYGEDEDVVRLMTVHQAKGLEFETVIVPNLGGSPNRRTENTLIDPKWGILCEINYGLDRKRLPNVLMQKIRMSELQRETEEEKRLLYVALTRAKKILVLGEGYRKNARGKWLSYLDRAGIDLGQKLPARSLDTKPEPVPHRRDPSSKRSVDVEGLLRWEPPAPREIWLSPSHLTTLGKCERLFFLTQIAGLDEHPPRLPGSGGAAAKGTVAHRVLELIGFSEPVGGWEEEIGRIIQISAQAEKLSEEDRIELRDRLARFLRGPVWRRWDDNEGIEREVPFALRLDGNEIIVRVEGKIDLVAPGPEPLLIDYKYETRSTDSGKYNLQTDLYALALFKNFDAPKVRAEIHFLLDDESECLAREIDNPEEIIRNVLALARNYSGKIRREDPLAWDKADRSYCERVRCGFRGYCYG